MRDDGRGGTVCSVCPVSTALLVTIRDYQHGVLRIAQTTFAGGD